MVKRLAVKTLGPVSDLERHLPAEWWKTLFTSLYIKTDGDVVENDENTVSEVDLLITACKLENDMSILDLCCGQGRHVLELARRGFKHVIGIDRSRYLTRLARKRAQQQGLPVQFREGDARHVRLPQDSIDVVCMMGNSFGYFEREEDDIAVLKSVRKVLKSKGRLALDIADGEWLRSNYENRSWEWVDEDHFVCRERSLSQDKGRIISREVIVHAERGVIADQFYAERLYDRKQITSILEELGFMKISVNKNGDTHSTRGQDLGMMAHRLFITATGPFKEAIRAKKPVTKKICVVMGDPSLPDSVKMNGHFNSEDMQTISRLKQALEPLDHYHFDYLDSHEDLLARLQKKRPSLVFNLCDEGFKNLATQELHVPALLEMLNIPYTGAGPASLGLCYNKAIIRSIAKELDVPVPDETYFDPSDQAANIPSIFPALLKPAWGDSSEGITQNSVVHNAQELMNYLDYLRDHYPNRPILIQEYLSGTEYSVGIIGNIGNYTVLPLLEVNYSKLPPELPPILSYESKWDPDSPYWTDISYLESPLEEEAKRRLIDDSIKLFERTGCRDYARFDFRADVNGTIKLLEVNPNPGWCWDGKLNLMAGFQGMSYGELLAMILRAATDRIESK